MTSPRKRAHTVATVEEIESIEGPDTLTWHPVRAHFEIRAFGTNAYTAGEAGRDVVEPHDESTDEGYGHEELYFVAAGRARFTIDGDTFDAPAGTYVFIPEPTSHRHAVAEEPGTTVLSFGGPPTFEPSAWEWTFRAMPLRKSDPDRAREILEDGRAAHPESPGIAFAFARLAALEGDNSGALAELGAAIGSWPNVAMAAREHEDFGAMREDPAFLELTG